MNKSLKNWLMVNISRSASRLCLVVGLGIVFALQSGCKDDLPERPEAPLEDIDYLGGDDGESGGPIDGPIDLSNWKVTLPILIPTQVFLHSTLRIPERS